MPRIPPHSLYQVFKAELLDLWPVFLSQLLSSALDLVLFLGVSDPVCFPCLGTSDHLPALLSFVFFLLYFWSLHIGWDLTRKKNNIPVVTSPPQSRVGKKMCKVFIIDSSVCTWSASPDGVKGLCGPFCVVSQLNSAS